jgi:hypothetical protein
MRTSYDQFRFDHCVSLLTAIRPCQPLKRPFAGQPTFAHGFHERSTLTGHMPNGAVSVYFKEETENGNFNIVRS